LTRASLTEALRGVLTDETRQRAKELGTKLRADDGNARAVAVLLGLVGGSKQRSDAAAPAGLSPMPMLS